MEQTIRLKVKKELSREEDKQVIRLKGLLIAKGFTDIIHISDDGEEHYINSFMAASRREVLDFITLFLSEAELEDVLSVL